MSSDFEVGYSLRVSVKVFFPYNGGSQIIIPKFGLAHVLKLFLKC